MALRQITGNAIWEALGSILVGVIFTVVAVFLVDRNREFLVGEAIIGPVRDRVLQALIANEAIERVTCLHLELVGPQKLFVVASVDIVGDDREYVLAVPSAGGRGNGVTARHDRARRALAVLAGAGVASSQGTGTRNSPHTDSFATGLPCRPCR